MLATKAAIDELPASHAHLLLAFAAVAAAVAGICREHRPHPRRRSDAWDLWSSSSDGGGEETPR